MLFYWWPDYADPYSWFINLFHSANPPYFNLAYYDNSTVDKQIDQVEPLSATNRPKAIQLYTQIQTTLLKDSPALFLGTQTYERAMQKSVGGFVDNPAYPSVVFVYSLTAWSVIRYAARRLALGVLVVVGVVVLTFLIARVIPGDPAVTYAGPRASKAQLEQTRQQLGPGQAGARAAGGLPEGDRDRRLGHVLPHEAAGAVGPEDGAAGLDRAGHRGALPGARWSACRWG